MSNRKVVPFAAVSPRPASPAIVKEIPIKDIIFCEGTNPRLGLDEGVVENFMDLYGDPDYQKIPAIEVLAIQGGPHGVQYLTLEGLHRIEACKRLQRKTIKAAVHADVAYTVPDLESKTTRNEILFRANPYNAICPTILKKAEKKQSALALRSQYTVQEIADSLGVSPKVVRGYTDEEAKQALAEVKAEAIKRFSAGESLNTVLREMQKKRPKLDKTTVIAWKKEAGLSSGGGSRKLPKGQNPTTPPGDGGTGDITGSDFPGSRPSGGDRLTPRSEPSDGFLPLDSPPGDGGQTGQAPPTVEQPQPPSKADIKKSIEILKTFHEQSRTMAWAPEVEDVFLTAVLDVLQEVSPRMGEMLGKKQLTDTAIRYQRLYEEECGRHNESNKESLKKSEEIARLKKELAARTGAHCTSECEHAKKWVKAEVVESMDILLTLLALHKMAAEEGHIAEKRTTTAGKKETVIPVPKEATESYRYLADRTGRHVFSQVEWAINRKVVTPAVKARFEQLLALSKTLPYSREKDYQTRAAQVKANLEVLCAEGGLAL